MPQAQTYQSEFTGQEMDARFTAVAEIAAQLQSLVLGLADYYTKSEVDQLLAAINGMEYIDVATLPTASADTLGKIYLVGPDGSGYYAYYYTSYDGSAYSWVGPLGTTQISLANYATKDEFNQLDQKTDLLTDETSVQSPNLFNKVTVTEGDTGISKNSGNTFGYSGGVGSDFIPIPEGATSLYPNIHKEGGSAGWALYNSSKTFTTGGNTYPIPIAEGDAYVRYTLPSDSASLDAAMLVVGTAADVPAEYMPYGTITTYSIKDDIIDTDQIVDGAVTADKIADGAITSEKTDIFKTVVGKNKLNINDPDYVTGKYLGTDGTWYTSGTGSVDTSGFIPFTQEMANLIIGYNGGGLENELTYSGVCLYDGQKQFVAGSAYSTNHGLATWQSGVAYARFAVRHVTEDKTKYMVEIGTTRTAFQPYQSWKELTDTTVNVSPNVPDKSLDGDVLKDGSVDSEKLAPGVSFPSIRPALSAIGMQGFADTISLAAGATATFDNFPQYVKRNFNISAAGRLTAFNEFEVGVGGAANNSLLVRIDATNAVLYRHNGTTYQSIETKAHGLTIASFLDVNVVCKDGIVTARIMTAGGGAKVSFAEVANYDIYGYPFVKASSGTTFSSLDVRISTASFSRPVWVLGDSYVSWYDNRWPKQLTDLFGVENYHLQGMAGGGSAAMYGDLVKALDFGVPRFLVWCIGMNDAADTYESYLAQLETLCENNGITLVLQTIPWPTGGSKADINAAVKASGYRYVDAYAAVSADNNGTWYTGMNDDGTHTTELGAKAIAARFLVDFPEIMSLNP